MDNNLRRRALIGLGAAATGAAATGGLASKAVAAVTGAPSKPERAGSRPGASAAPNSVVRNVRDFGAVGDGDADDTAAVASACAPAGSGPLVLYLPAGIYRVTKWPALPDHAQVQGDGADNSTVLYEEDGTLITLQGRQRVRFTRMGIWATGRQSTAVRVSGCFRCSFESVLIRGNHTSGNYPAYVKQRGLVLDQNTGGTTFVDCDINNFGYGIVTSCIQNYVTASKLASNHVGVLGTGDNFAAGLAIANTEFVSDRDPHTTDRHIDIDGPANDWWLTNVWFEGADTAVTVGRAGAGGPSQFGMVNCKVAARTVCLDLQHCRQPYLANVIFDADSDAQVPAEMRINSTWCAEGTAVNLISGIHTDIDPAVYPPKWQVTGRGHIYGAQLVGTTIFNAGGEDDVLRVQSGGDTTLSAVRSDGTWVSHRANAGVVLRDANNVYWRLKVGTDGTLKTERAS